MEKQKRWRFWLIGAVILLTVYNILPTLFYYTKPLKAQVDAPRANQTAVAIVDRVNRLEKDAIAWAGSFCKLLHLSPNSIELDPQQPERVVLSFKTEEDASTFGHHLPRAGSLIPFVPAQLSLEEAVQGTTVSLQRKIPIHFDPNQINSFFQFSYKFDSQGNPSDLYRALINDRIAVIAIALGGVSENALMMQGAAGNISDPQIEEQILLAARSINNFVASFGSDSEIAHRYFATFTQTNSVEKNAIVPRFLTAIAQLKEKLRQERSVLESKKGEDLFLSGADQQLLDNVAKREKTLTAAETTIRNHTAAFHASASPLTYPMIGSLLRDSEQKIDQRSNVQVLSLEGRHPFVQDLWIDWRNEKIALRLYPDVVSYKERASGNLKNGIDQFIYNDLAAVARQASEQILPQGELFEIALSKLEGSKSFLALRLATIAQAQVRQVKQELLVSWTPRHPDLNKDNFPVWDYEQTLNLSAAQKKLGMVIYVPALQPDQLPRSMRMNSIYVVAKGVDHILQRLRSAPDSESARQFFQDFNQLRQILHKDGFLGYSGAYLGKEFAGDYVFEAEDYFQNVLKATREDFSVHGTKRYAVLEFSDVEQRILTLNKIDTRIHEDLLKWRDDYEAAALGLRGSSPYDVPKPTQSPLWSNCKLSFIKYFRGDERKILHWGLDLSGGKTVQIALRDTNGRLVTNEQEVKQGINELYSRVNKMGVSEVGIRQEGNAITLDFPGSQGLSAAELIKASSMYFHVVNEKFSGSHTPLKEATNQFLQEVWNEATVTNRKTVEDINAIAWRHLYGDSVDPNNASPRSEAAQALYLAGLRLANPQDPAVSNAFNDAYSKIAILRGDSFTDWQGNTHPLLFIFRNYALEGSALQDIQASYNPSKGNFLAFNVASSLRTKKGQKTNPRDDLYAWTSQFSQEKIGGTPNETYTQARGWRMAVILNGSVISSPALEASLSDSAMISGSFSQREVNQLEADLKAGSLSFTPHILSEKNVSPELGSQERTRGIWATAIAFILVIGVMIGYYRFAGTVASIGVLFNLLLLWAILQNLQATLSLAGIAGIILTVGIAVDANVLVFERIREEFAQTGRIGSALHAGYRKAFSAIIDSNITTLIAALILLHFDAGPIKGFAVTLIIGIISSLFTALFMTRTFFAHWVQNPAHKALSMAQLVKGTHFNFLKYTKQTITFSAVVIIAGGLLTFKERHTILGMDFMGGYALSMELTPKSGIDYRKGVENALIAGGVSTQELQVRELHPSNLVRIFLSKNLNEPGRPFFGLQATAETNPKIDWVVAALESGGLSIAPHVKQQLASGWTEVSGQMSDTMRQEALIGLAIALICILIYITIRFEFAYALSATLCLLHDVVFSIGAIAILHFCGVSLQIDLNTVAALMTIVGYSLNDTIIVFDRIREDARAMRKHTLSEVINHALNITLSRTLMTSGVTLLVLLPLVLLGGSTLFSFGLVMAIGVIFGTLSSLFVAAPLMQYFHNKELSRKQRLGVVSK